MTAPSTPSLAELHKRAAAGEARAQYQLAAQLSVRGEKDKADRLLKAAAEQGFGDALYTLATRRLDDSGMTDAAAMLERAAENGSAPALRLLAVMRANGFGVDEDWSAAVAQILGAAKQNSPAAMREIAMLLFAHDPDDADGAALFALAAPKDPCAGAILVRRACNGRLHADSQAASRLLDLLENAQYPNASALAAALHTVPAAQTGNALAPDWDRVEAMLSRQPEKLSHQAESVCPSPSARVYRKAFTLEECEYIIASSARLLAPSMIADPQTRESRQDEYRSSLTAIMSIVDLDLPLTVFNRRLALLAGHSPEHAESLGVLLYAPGKEYRPHFDWLPDGPERARGGQRVTTALLYLNNEYEGGETHFLSPDIRFRGNPGDVLVFENTLETGKPDPSTRHAGLPVKSGVKWLGSTWFREKKYIR
ncbi:2OG-Fe(II) oxygenase [Hyphococcus sp.]|uniref:2OG-Fe(II) oxygenase n=1 Tax=Hyphococcus sp. TaxID=2038636 RepID=UPI00207DC501|nr:MAG: hypothetical protein DHS20C04_21430 [Marinicaulis sp.]